MSTPSSLAEQARFVPGSIVTVDLVNGAPSPAYDIVIGQNILSETASLMRQRLGVRRCVIISDTNVDPLYRAQVEAILTAGGHQVITSLTVPAGEASKNFTRVQFLVDQILAAGIDRKTVILALGGGVVGDLSGFAASMVLRGVDLVQIPTSLLAQVDSSVGGKNGIDTAWGKNTVGAFYQPRLVVADVSLLSSLPQREMRSGYAEIVKYGLIADPDFFHWCVTHGAQLLAADPEAQIHAVRHSCECKAKIVAADPHETEGIRALLNLGHTFGHAMEAATGFGSLLVHGEAVAIGTLMAFRLSVRMGLCPPQDYDLVRSHFLMMGLPLLPPPMGCSIDRLIELMQADKKADNGKITLILAHGIGKCFVCPDANVHGIRAVWEEFLL